MEQVILKPLSVQVKNTLQQTKVSSTKTVTAEQVKTFAPITKTQEISYIVNQVDKEFKKRADEINALTIELEEKERDLEYCENETKKQGDVLSLLNSSLSYRKQTFEQLKQRLGKFSSEKYSHVISYSAYDKEKSTECK